MIGEILSFLSLKIKIQFYNLRVEIKLERTYTYLGVDYQGKVVYCEVCSSGRRVNPKFE